MTPPLLRESVPSTLQFRASSEPKMASPTELLASGAAHGYSPPMRRLLLILLLITSPALAADFSARVVGISDGDTLTVLTAEKRIVKVRLYGVDAPETGQDFGSRAKQAASDLAFGKTVTIRE